MRTTKTAATRYFGSRRRRSVVSRSGSRAARCTQAAGDVHQLWVWHQHRDRARRSVQLKLPRRRTAAEPETGPEHGGRGTGRPAGRYGQPGISGADEPPAAKAAAAAAGQCPAGKNRCVQLLAGRPLLPHPPEQPERAAGKLLTAASGREESGTLERADPDVSGVGYPAGQQL